MGKQKTVIVGGGIAGLAAARTLQQAGADWLLLEAGDCLGGRVASERVDGFILDRGFQVFNSAYQTVRELVDIRQLQLRPFIPGARIHGRGCTKLILDPRRLPQAAWRLGRPFIPGAGDVLRMMRLFSEAGSLSRRVSIPAANVATLDELERRGFSRQLIEWFFQPFFAGVFLDPDLSTSWRCLVSQFSYFANGLACLPRMGMMHIPELLARSLPANRIRPGSRVVKLQSRAVDTGDGESFEFDRLILALDLPEYEKLAGCDSGRRMRGVCCFYFAAPEAPYREPLLSLAAAQEPGPVATLAVLTNLHPDYAADSRALISVSVLGNPTGDDLPGVILDQLAQWYGPEVHRWQPLKRYTIPHALPAQTPQDIEQLNGKHHLGDGIYLCGDHTALPSINGAAASGIMAASEVLKDTGQH